MSDAVREVSVYRVADGMLTGHSLTASAHSIEINTPPGCGVVAGRHDHLSKRVDLATGEVVDWQPPAPPDTDLETFEWDALSEPPRPRWRAKPTAKAVKQAKQALVQERMDKLEVTQARPLRELMIDPNDAQARAKLVALEAQFAELRIEFTNPP